MKDFNDSIIFDSDSYKVSHYLQYPEGTSAMFSYIESRGGKFDETVFFGLQYILNRIVENPVTEEDVLLADEIYSAHGLKLNKEGWLHIVKKHNGLPPVRIRAVPEGTVVPISNALLTIESTDPECFWIVSWLETILMRLWYSINIATTSYHAKKIFKKFLQETSDDMNGIDFMLHDFGARGASSHESISIGGVAHLSSFLGTDSLASLLCARKYYNAPIAGFSIPAAEHSTITSWGQYGEVKAYSNMIDKFSSPGSAYSVVSDSYDIFSACENIWGGVLKEKVISSGGKLVVRPDSGNPVYVLPKIMNILGDKFGFTINSKGFKILNHVGVIWGDGININDITPILKAVTEAGWSASNVVFGMGGGLIQQHDRDTQKMAMKCSSVCINGKWVDVFKNPVTDTEKVSKKGRLDLIRDEEGVFKTVKLSDEQKEGENSELKLAYENGNIFTNDSLENIRERVSSSL